METQVKRQVQPQRWVAAVALAFLATTAQAHPGHGVDAITGGLASGIAHPFLGLDHLLAMVAVGLWSAVALPAGRRWAGPATFLAMLLAGALLAAAGLPLPSIEIDIALSVILLGGMLLAHRHVPASIGLAMIAAAALLHGHAHGSEWVRGSSFAGYAAGFMLASAALHGIGLAAGGRVQRLAPWAWKASATLIGASGLLMLAARL